MSHSLRHNNISNLSHCYGCGVCAVICPEKIIYLKENKEGFYSPVITDQNKCIDCGLCLKTCAFINPVDCTNDIESFAGWSEDPDIRRICSSGGIGFEIARNKFKLGYNICAVKYDTKSARAKHFFVQTEDDLFLTIGSKYIQSYTLDAINELNFSAKNLVIGTPCQIASLRRLIKLRKKEYNFILVDFFCHGVPPLTLWDKYIAKAEEKIGKITFASWRNKLRGWHDSWIISLRGDKLSSFNQKSANLLTSCKHEVETKDDVYISPMSNGDLFYKFFLSNVCLNECCYNCKYKMSASCADIRIGDLWGKKYSSNQKGVSAILAFTEKGKDTLREIENRCTLKSESFMNVTEGQMSSSPKKPYIRKWIIHALTTDIQLTTINRILFKIYSLSTIPSRFLKKIQKYNR